MTPDQRIADYQDAYFAANERCIGVTYAAGWYRVGHPARKYRSSQIDAFTTELRRRVAQAGETGTAETTKIGSVHEHAVPKGCAQGEPS